MSKDGGPAFPYTNCEDHGISGGYGMSLRDWFAGCALIGALANGEITPVDPAEIAEDCYISADAMLREREKK